MCDSELFFSIFCCGISLESAAVMIQIDGKFDPASAGTFDMNQFRRHSRATHWFGFCRHFVSGLSEAINICGQYHAFRCKSSLDQRTQSVMKMGYFLLPRLALLGAYPAFISSFAYQCLTGSLLTPPVLTASLTVTVSHPISPYALDWFWALYPVEG